MISRSVLMAAVIVLCFLAATGAVKLLIYYLRRYEIYDLPNTRSMHDQPKVRGGGLGIVFVMVAVALSIETFAGQSMMGLVILIVGLAFLGLLDDVYSLPWWLRFIGQAALALFFLVNLYNGLTLEIFTVNVNRQSLVMILSLVWIVYMANIYNFMDGIDGIAGAYGAICAGIIGVWFLLAGAFLWGLFAFSVMAGCCGFLVWNWTPARIFMGDSGSIALGGTFAALALIAQQEYHLPMSAFFLLFAVFLADASYTLLKRAFRGERVWEAHKEHVYQIAVERGYSHGRVTAFAVLLTAILSFPATLEIYGIGNSLVWLFFSTGLLIAGFYVLTIREVLPR